MTIQKALPDDLIDSLLSNYKKPEDVIGENGLLKQLTKAQVERALQAEMAEHLGHDKHETVRNSTGNALNGKSRKTLNRNNPDSDHDLYQAVIEKIDRMRAVSV